MSNVRKYFKNHQSLKVLASSSLNSAGQQVESADYIQSKIEEINRFIPNVDFTTSSNFARYGSVEKYYKDSFYYVYSEYPYDGSHKEKVNWELSGTYFDRYVFKDLYPRTNGYVNIGYDYGSVTPSAGVFSTPGNIEYIYFKGGPHRSPTLPVTTLSQQFTASNIYDADTRQESNIEIDGNYGFSLEFWLKKDGWSASNESRRQVILDVWNSGTVDSSEEGRFLVFLDRSPGGRFNVNIRSGSVINEIEIGSELPITGNTWNHYSLTFKNDGSNLTTKLYRNGNYLATNTTSSIGRVTGSMIGYVGALATDSGAGDSEGDGKLSGSLDELRLWKVERTPEQIGRNWFTQVYGGTNSDYNTVGTGSAKYSPGNPVDLGVYFKFNEGIFNTSSVDPLDQVILDYSGRATNGQWNGYTLGARQTGSAMTESSASLSEFKDPILYENHYLVKNKLNDLSISGSLYDARNSSNIFKSLPSWIQEEDLKNDRGTLENLTQIIGSYFDTLHLQIQSAPDIKNVNYLTSSSKPLPFTSRVIESTGFNIAELFNDASIMEMYGDRDDFREYENKLSDIKNRIYSNIHNNLVGILKSKGTEKSFRNLIRCYGVDEQLLKLNLYGNNVTHLIRDNFEDVSTIKKYVSFNSETRNGSTVYQQSSSADTTNTRSYISGSTDLEYVANTYESEFIFPKIGEIGKENHYIPNYLTSSLFGSHTPPTDDPNVIMYATDDVSGIDVQVVRIRDNNSKFKNSAFFRVTGTLIPELTSSLFNNVYDNSRWNLSARIKPSSYPYAGSLSGTVSSSYDFIFSGYNAVSDEIVNEFTVTASLSHFNGKRFSTSSKRFYLGSQRQDFTGSINYYSGVKATSLRAWMTYLDDNTLKAHAIDPTNYGVKNLLENAYRTQKSEDFGQNVPLIPQIDTLALHWNFDTVTGSNSSGEFLVDDFSSGSQSETTKYSWLGPIIKYQHTGLGDFFPNSDTGSVQREFVLAAQQQQPEVLNSSNMIELVDSNDDSLFTRETRPMSFYFSVEKSPYAIVTDEIVRLFATIIDFNNLIGDPVNRYRMSYKQMEKARQKFFERVENETIDFEKFVDYYKWFDNSISLTLSQLFPASADFSERIRTLVESHALERNKYWSKFPTLDSHKRGTIHLSAVMQNISTQDTASNDDKDRT